MKQLDRITMDPAVMGGKPCIRGMRVTVGTVVGLMASGKAIEEVLASYPYIEGRCRTSPHIRGMAIGGKGPLVS